MSFILSVKNKFKFLWIRIVAPAILNSIFLFSRRNKKRLLVIKTDGIGDYILFRNYLQFLKSSDKYKDHSIYLLTNTANKDFAISMDAKFVDGFFCYADGYFLKWKLVGLLYRLQQLKVSTIIYPNYSRKYPVDWLVGHVRATYKIGVDGDTMNEPLPLKLKGDKYYTQLIKPKDSIPHEFDRNKQIFEEITGHKCDFKKPFIDKNDLDIVPNDSVVIFPGGSEPSKRWPPANFSQLCKQIISELKTPIILTGGKDEIEIGNEISKNIPANNVSNKINALSLVELCSVIGSAKLLISNDSVAIHIGVALNIPVIAISKGDIYGRFIPYPAHIYKQLENITPPGFHPGADKYTQWSSSYINNIRVEDVFDAAQRSLNSKKVEST